MARPPKILFLINEELGQANVCLSVLHSLLILSSPEIHLASWPNLQSRIQEISSNASLTTGLDHTVTFHPLPCLGMVKSVYRHVTDSIPGHGRGFINAFRVYSDLRLVLSPRSTKEYLEIYDRCVEIIEEVRSDLVVLEPLFAFGFDACKRLNQKYVVVAPNALKDVALFEQPRLAMLWKFPVLGSGFRYPVPWYLIPANIFLILVLIIVIATAPEFRHLTKQRKRKGITNIYPLFEPYDKKIQYIYPAAPELDFPLQCPSNITLCGPILLPVQPVSQADSNLHTWLNRAPTVLIHFGSHFIADFNFASEMAGAIRIFLDKCPNAQVLWKLIKHGGYDDSFSDVLAQELITDRVRITGWLDAEPLAILQTGHISCVVHHGGATSYYEAISTGVPQVVCPLWLDCLDYAARVEWLGIGRDANRKVGYPIEANELGMAMASVVGYQGHFALSDGMRERARGLAVSSRKHGGSGAAAEKVLEILKEK